MTPTDRLIAYRGLAARFGWDVIVSWMPVSAPLLGCAFRVRGETAYRIHLREDLGAEPFREVCVFAHELAHLLRGHWKLDVEPEAADAPPVPRRRLADRAENEDQRKVLAAFDRQHDEEEQDASEASSYLLLKWVNEEWLPRVLVDWLCA